MLKVNEKRVAALLALTAVHDIMKMDCILPKLQGEHAPFHGYAAGDTIGDHDLALAYVLEYFPKLLPSFEGLPDKLRQTILFTQSKMDFNNGWLVQGEAPPGKLLRVFKRVVGDGKVSPQDVAFYFVHW